jgi:hypothetical protein
MPDQNNRSFAGCPDRPELRFEQRHAPRRTPDPDRHGASSTRRCRETWGRAGAKACRCDQPILRPRLRDLSRLRLARSDAAPTPHHRTRLVTERLPHPLEFERHPSAHRTGLQRTPLDPRHPTRPRPPPIRCRGSARTNRSEAPRPATHHDNCSSHSLTNSLPSQG